MADNQISQSIEELMTKDYVETTKRFNQDKIIKIKQLVNNLKDCAKQIQDIQYKQGLIESHQDVITYLETGLVYDLKDQKELDEIYNKSFHLINEIGTIVRGDKKNIILTVYEEDSEGNLLGVYSKEENLIEFKTPESQRAEKFTQQLNFSLSDLKEEFKEQKISDSFKNYYKNFRNVGTNPKYFHGYNVGHIQEAFDRHWSIYNPKKTPSNKNFIPTDFSDSRERQIVHILITYAKNSTSWRHGGDNAWRQVKGGKYGNINRVVSDFLTIENTINDVIRTWTDDGKISKDFQNLFKTVYKDGLDKEIDKTLNQKTDKEIEEIIKRLRLKIKT